MAVQVVCYQLYVDEIINREPNKSEYWDVPTAESNHVKRLINHFIEVSEQLEVFNKETQGRSVLESKDVHKNRA